MVVSAANVVLGINVVVPKKSRPRTHELLHYRHTRTKALVISLRHRMPTGRIDGGTATKQRGGPTAHPEASPPATRARLRELTGRSIIHVTMPSSSRSGQVASFFQPLFLQFWCVMAARARSATTATMMMRITIASSRRRQREIVDVGNPSPSTYACRGGDTKREPARAVDGETWDFASGLLEIAAPPPSPRRAVTITQPSNQ